MKHVFDEWPQIQAAMEATPHLLVMLDFDGTLSPIVEHPDLATLPPPTKTLLAELAATPAVEVAVVSGRSIADLRPRVGVEGIEYIGNHGRERLRPGRTEVEMEAAVKHRMAAVKEKVRQAAASIPGAYLEDKGLTVALHYRQVPVEGHPTVRQKVEKINRELGDTIEVCQGKRVFDFLPADNQSKGRAVTGLLAEKEGVDRTLAIYCGDDTTDETVFESLAAESITVYVGEDNTSSAARYRLDDPNQVKEFLARIISLRRARSVEF